MVGKATGYVPRFRSRAKSFRSRTPANSRSMLPTTDSLAQFAHPGVPEISVEKPEGPIFQGFGRATVMLHLMVRSVSQNRAPDAHSREKFPGRPHLEIASEEIAECSVTPQGLPRIV